ncbi:MAG TPA: transketolase C-terminal domain-containing protein [Candidatus Limnocylindrales bacterium]|nr:transketolase C-terminal domain-containing protein [Candidatus Limnocylindrales bacterium]
MGKATRVAFGDALLRIGATHPRVVVLDADLASSVQTKKFGDAFPDRFFQVGIAEGNMVGMAAGMALCGLTPFAASFACFLTGRFEQIRMSIGYNNANVRLVGTHSGIGIGEDGYSQMGLEDIALMRSLPNMVVLQPADCREAERATEFLADYVGGPAYLRLTRQNVDDVNGEGYRFEFGKGVEIRDGSDVTIVASGAVVGESIRAAERLAKDGISAGVVNLHTIKPIDSALLLKLAGKTGRILTVEDHGVTGGVGGAVVEALAEVPDVVVRIHGVHGYGESGTGADLYAKHGLDEAGIARVAKEFVWADQKRAKAHA